jgi:hypothetical protein
VSNRAKYPLPEVDDPEASRCFKVYVPDEPGHIQAFWGALYSLTRWYQWARDPQKRGKDVAAAWMKRFIMTLATQDEECTATMAIMFRQDECAIEYSLNNGETWELLADLSLCPPAIEELQKRLRYLPGGSLVWYDPKEDTYRPFWWGTPPNPQSVAPRRTRPEEPGQTLRCRFTQSLMSKLIYAYNETARYKAGGGFFLSVIIQFLRIWLVNFNVGDLGDQAVGPMVASLIDNWPAFFQNGLNDDAVRAIFCILLRIVPDDGQITPGIVQQIVELTDGQPSQSARRGIAAWLDVLGAVGVQNAGAAEPEAFIIPCSECDNEMSSGNRPYVVTFGDAYGDLPQGWPHYTVQGAVRIPSGGHIGPYILIENRTPCAVTVRFPETTFPAMGSVAFRWRSIRPMAPAASQVRMRMRFYDAGTNILLDTNGGWMTTTYAWNYYQLYHTNQVTGAVKVVLDFYHEPNQNGVWDYGIDHIVVN